MVPEGTLINKKKDRQAKELIVIEALRCLFLSFKGHISWLDGVIMRHYNGF